MSTPESIDGRIVQYVEESEHAPKHYVAQNGDLYTGRCEDTRLMGHPATVDSSLLEERRDFLEEVVDDVIPVRKACFRNAFEAWHQFDELEYVEGYAEFKDLVTEHAWLQLDGKLVDITIDGFENYYGVTFSDELLSRYYDMGGDIRACGILGNYKNDFEFLQSQGYWE